MQLRWKRFWLGMDFLLGVWLVGVLWLMREGSPHWWWPGFAIGGLYVVVRFAVLAIDHARTWRLWALFDLAVWAIVLAMAYLAELRGPAWAAAGFALLVAHVVFLKWRERRRRPRRTGDVV